MDLKYYPTSESSNCKVENRLMQFQRRIFLYFVTMRVLFLSSITRVTQFIGRIQLNLLPYSKSSKYDMSTSSGIYTKSNFSQVSESAKQIKYIKKKVGLVLSYVGSNYNGLQIDSTGTYVTIESVVVNELYRLGCIKETNKNDISKIAWNRSSRTDKGVHCAGLVISAKIELDPNWISEVDPFTISTLPELINERLPNDIRVLSCFRLTQSFRARQNCYWREYEYLLPIEVILDHDEKFPIQTSYNRSLTMSRSECREAFLSKLGIALKKLEGTGSYHNFHRMKRRDLKGYRLLRGVDDVAVNPKSPTDISLENECEGEENDNEFDDGINSMINTDDVTNSSVDDPALSQEYNLFRRWTPSNRDMLEKTVGNIYCCELLGVHTIDNGQELARIRVRGQSFLLHQIRIMVGAALMVARGHMPVEVLEAALTLPVHVPLPMAPAEGLLLVNSGYILNGEPKGTSVLYTLCPQDRPANFPAVDRPLLTETQYREAQRFKEHHIYPQVALDWRDNRIMQSWLEENDIRYSCVYYSNSTPAQPVPSSPPSSFNDRSMNPCELSNEEVNTPTSALFWRRMVDEYLNRPERVARQKEMEVKILERRARFLHAIQTAPVETLSTCTQGCEKTQKYKNSKRNKNNKMVNLEPESFEAATLRLVTYQELIPPGMASALALQTRVPPGTELFQGLKAIASLIVSGQVGLEATSDEVALLVAARGGLQWLVKQPIHPLLNKN